MNKEYKEALKDGRWQIRKTEIMQRDGFACVKCGASASDGVVLNIHHLNYYPDRNPWEYEDKDLITLCEDCHKKEHQQSSPKENYWSFDDLEKLKGKFVYIEDDSENYIFLLGNVIESRTEHDYLEDKYSVIWHPASIKIKMMACGVAPYFKDFEFSGLGSGADIVYTTIHDPIVIKRSSKVTVLEGKTEENTLNNMIWGVSHDLQMLTLQQNYMRDHDNDFNEDHARFDREEYEYVIYALLGHKFRLQYRTQNNYFQLEMLFIKKYTKEWNTLFDENGKDSSIRDVVIWCIKENNIKFSIPEVQWAFDIIEKHKDDSGFDFMYFVKHTKELNLTDLQKGFIEELKELPPTKLGRIFIQEETPKQKADRIKHLIFDIQYIQLESRMKEITSQMKGISDPNIFMPLMKEFNALKIKRDDIMCVTGRDVSK